MAWRIRERGRTTGPRPRPYFQKRFGRLVWRRSSAARPATAAGVELTDSSEVVARRVAAYMDMVASVVLPLAYLLFILIYILSFNSISKDFSGTKFVHEDPSGDTSSSCCYHKGPAQ